MVSIGKEGKAHYEMVRSIISRPYFIFDELIAKRKRQEKEAKRISEAWENGYRYGIANGDQKGYREGWEEGFKQGKKNLELSEKELKELMKYHKE